MGSFTQLTYHVVFGTKYRQPRITDAMQERLYEYIGGTIRAKNGHLIEIGGVTDHIHILARLSPALSVADVVRDIKANSDDYRDYLRGKRLAMVFEKESLRTRFTFDIGMQDLGGSATFLDLSNGARMGARESVRYLAKNLERWTHGIVARTYRHRTVVELAQTASVPVINGLTDLLHPCQALADMMTLFEHWGEVAGKKPPRLPIPNGIANVAPSPWSSGPTT